MNASLKKKKSHQLSKVIKKVNGIEISAIEIQIRKIIIIEITVPIKSLLKSIKTYYDLQENFINYNIIKYKLNLFIIE